MFILHFFTNRFWIVNSHRYSQSNSWRSLLNLKRTTEKISFVDLIIRKNYSSRLSDLMVAFSVVIQARLNIIVIPGSHTAIRNISPLIPGIPRILHNLFLQRKTHYCYIRHIHDSFTNMIVSHAARWNFWFFLGNLYDLSYKFVNRQMGNPREFTSWKLLYAKYSILRDSSILLKFPRLQSHLLLQTFEKSWCHTAHVCTYV